MDAVRYERAAMRSPINWALLGLLNRAPGYGYELMQRFKEAYPGTLELSSPSQIYTALDTLERHGLISSRREAPVADPVRQRKFRYSVTKAGICTYEHWLVDQISEPAERSQLLGAHVATLGADALHVLDRCRDICLEIVEGLSAAHETEGVSALADRLAAEDRRLRASAVLAWIEYARSELAGGDQEQP